MNRIIILLDTMGIFCLDRTILKTIEKPDKTTLIMFYWICVNRIMCVIICFIYIYLSMSIFSTGHIYIKICVRTTVKIITQNSANRVINTRTISFCEH